MTPERIVLTAGDASASIAPANGGMLLSLRVADQELLVQPRGGLGPAPTFGSFLMAPWVGELALGMVEFRGRRAQIPPNHGRHAIHGLVATGAWEVVQASTTSATLVQELRSPWPFGGVVEQSIRLDPAGITLEAAITAERDAMPAALGWHPWFACPEPDRVRVRVDAASQLELDDELLPTGAVRPVAADTDLRDGPIIGNRRIDAVYVGARSPARLGLPELEVRIHFDPAIDNIVVYTSPGAVCVEPWSAWPNALGMATVGLESGLEALEPGESLKRWTRWEW